MSADHSEAAMGQWRELHNVDLIVSEFTFPEIKQVRELLPRYSHKVDKLGRPLVFLEFEHADGTKLFQFTDQARFMKHHIRTMEKMDQYFI